MEVVTDFGALANSDDVVRRLEEEPTARMLVMIDEYLEDASDQARDYGVSNWTLDNVPSPVRRLVAAAVARFIRNPDAFNTSRAADETLAWEEPANRPLFEPEEIDRLRRYAMMAQPIRQTFGTSDTYLYSRRREADTVYVPWGNEENKPFPWIAINDPNGYYRKW